MEIDFRLWDFSLKKFVELNDVTVLVFKAEKFYLSHSAGGEPHIPITGNDGYLLQKYFGVRDLRKRKIFEGDFCRSYNIHLLVRAGFDAVADGQIIFEDGAHYWQSFKRPGLRYLVNRKAGSTFEIIGNIFGDKPAPSDNKFFIESPPP